jgi:hypothetical protein
MVHIYVCCLRNIALRVNGYKFKERSYSCRVHFGINIYYYREVFPWLSTHEMQTSATGFSDLGRRYVMAFAVPKSAYLN